MSLGPQGKAATGGRSVSPAAPVGGRASPPAPVSQASPPPAWHPPPRPHLPRVGLARTARCLPPGHRLPLPSAASWRLRAAAAQPVRARAGRAEDVPAHFRGGASAPGRSWLRPDSPAPAADQQGGGLARRSLSFSPVDRFPSWPPGLPWGPPHMALSITSNLVATDRDCETEFSRQVWNSSRS